MDALYLLVIPIILTNGSWKKLFLQHAIYIRYIYIYVVLYIYIYIYETGIGTSSIATTKTLYHIDRMYWVYWSHLSKLHNRSVQSNIHYYISYNRYIYKLLVWNFLWYLPRTAWCAILELEWQIFAVFQKVTKCGQRLTEDCTGSLRGQELCNYDNIL